MKLKIEEATEIKICACNWYGLFAGFKGEPEQLINTFINSSHKKRKKIWKKIMLLKYDSNIEHKLLWLINSYISEDFSEKLIGKKWMRIIWRYLLKNKFYTINDKTTNNIRNIFYYTIRYTRTKYLKEEAWKHYIKFWIKNGDKYFKIKYFLRDLRMNGNDQAVTVAHNLNNQLGYEYP